MNLLFDENLPPSLVRRLARDYPESASVLKIGLGQGADTEIIAFAKAQGYTIVTKDADFYWHCLAHGHPPKVIWLRCGNLSPAALEDVLRRAKARVDAFAFSDEAYIIVSN